MAGDPQPETELCRLEVDGAVANVTLDRTDAFNALNPQLISDISEILEWTSRRSVGTTGELHSSDGDPNLRALVIRAEGCLLYTSPSPRDKRQSRMPSSA